MDLNIEKAGYIYSWSSQCKTDMKKKITEPQALWHCEFKVKL